MDEGKREAATRKEEEQNAIPGRETRLTSVQKQEDCGVQGSASWCFQFGGGGAWWELGRGGAHRTPWGACTSLQGGRLFHLCSKAAAPKSPHPRLKAGPRALMLWPDVSPHHPPASLLSLYLSL